MFVLGHRRIAVAVLAGLAVWASISALSQEPRQVAVPVAARDLPSGSTVGAQDITTAKFTESTAPAGLLTKAQLRSRVVAGPMRQGEPFTDARAITPQRLGSGEQLALIDLAAAHARLLRVGDRVDVVSLDADDGARTSVIARGAPVAVIEIPEDSGAASLGVAVPPDIAHSVMTAQLQAPLMVIPTKAP